MMSRFVGPRSRKLVLLSLLTGLVFGFTPISSALLHSVGGSFKKTPYSSLALESPPRVAAGFVAGRPIPVRLANETGHSETYHWNATENGTLISLGEVTIGSGRGITISVPTPGAIEGRLQVALVGTAVFLTVPIVRS